MRVHPLLFMSRPPADCEGTVIVYRTQNEDLAAAPALGRLGGRLTQLLDAAPDFDGVTELLIDAGELTSAVLDELLPHADDLHPAAAPWMAIVTSLARASDAVWRDDAPEHAAALKTALCAIETCTRSYVPREVTRSVSEGFAYDGLGPELYAEAARAWTGARAGERVVCIGVRTIGVTLAAAAAEGLRSRGVDASVLTVRPRGNPLDRSIVLTPRMERAIQQWTDATFLIVDEGPGPTGSSIACVADRLSALGVEDDRIVLMPGHEPDVSAMSNEHARWRWTRHSVVAPDFEGVWIESGRLASAFAADELQDVAAGRWRSRCQVAATTAVYPQHERRKFVAQGPNGRYWIKFVGLGRYGRSTLERAVCAAAAGWGPPVHAFKHGWLAMPELTGCALDAANPVAEPERLARYLDFIKRAWSTGAPAAPYALIEMGVQNIRALCGDREAERFETLVPVAHTEAVRVDGRQFPHEWISGGGVMVKTDGVDHHDDHFFPGPVDIAWDVAGVLEEWRMQGESERALIEQYQGLTGDHGITERLPFYRAAYLAFRGGYSSIAGEQLSATEDGERFRVAADWYRGRLQQVMNA
jgi:hypothetical protein